MPIEIVFASSASHRLANPHRMNSGTIRRDAPLQCGYLLKEELAELWEQRDGRAAPNPRVRAAFNPLRIDFVVRRLRGHLSSRRQSARSISAVACLPTLLFTLLSTWRRRAAVAVRMRANAGSVAGPMKFMIERSPAKQMRQLLQRPMYSGCSQRLSVRGRFKRQPHIKLCAIGTRAEVDFSVMPFDDDPVADNQAESGA